MITLKINAGHNQKLMEECWVLREYAQYVGKVRRYSEEMDLNAAVECAVNESIQEGILKEFLQKNRDEVIAMSIFEYNEEEEKKKLREAEYEAGKADGLRAGREEGRKEERLSLVEKMLEENEPVEKIVRYTGYGPDRSKEIAEQCRTGAENG